MGYCNHFAPNMLNNALYMCSGLYQEIKTWSILSCVTQRVQNSQYLMVVPRSAKISLRPDHNKANSYTFFPSHLMCNLMMNITLTISGKFVQMSRFPWGLYEKSWKSQPGIHSLGFLNMN
jgi:hypothetical protein